ncbi:MAG: hypothetical protein LBP62_02950 [Clostridiales bacterium]|jgi:hypothetical protein|nr:hypothetical protein [Clostridiales bacterium]
MSKLKKSLVGKIGYCDNKDLGINKSGGHYVYIRELSGDKCNVNVVTSLEDKDGFNNNRINKIRKGYVYPIPFYDANFSRWSGVNRLSVNNVKVIDIKDIDKKKIKRRHKFFIGKFSSK